jgi:hypothetical protein
VKTDKSTMRQAAMAAGTGLVLSGAVLFGSSIQKPSVAADEAAKPAVSGAKSEPAAPAGEAPMKEPDHITVQHILIGFTGSVPGKDIKRTKDEAKKVAYEVLAQAKKGQNYDDLVKLWTNDSPPGIYSMSNNGVAADRSKGEFARGGMVPAFGNVGFKLKVGEIGIADYDPQTSPYGWHIIKRIK